MKLPYGSSFGSAALDKCASCTQSTTGNTRSPRFDAYLVERKLPLNYSMRAQVWDRLSYSGLSDESPERHNRGIDRKYLYLLTICLAQCRKLTSRHGTERNTIQ